MLISISLILVGLAVLIFGADLLVRSVSALAAAAGVPPLVIGLTVVAFGTSMPEVVVNVLSSLHGETGLAFGNIVGSCTINIGFVLAITAIVRPLVVQPSMITRELPLMLLSVAALVIMTEDHRLTGAAIDSLSRADGLMLLLLFCMFLYVTIRGAMLQPAEDPLIAEVQEKIDRKHVQPGRGNAWNAMVLVIGLVGVAGGGRLTVYAAVDIAHALNIPDVIIGLTLVSFGTTLPELVTCIMAARRGQSDIALGNVVGSNLFNTLFIAGTVATISPIPVPLGGETDLLAMAALSAVTLPIAIRGPRKVTRMEGVFLLTAYGSYLAYRLLSIRTT